MDLQVLDWIAFYAFIIAVVFFYFFGAVSTAIWLFKYEAEWVHKVFRTEACLSPLFFIVLLLPVIFWPVFWLGFLIFKALAWLQKAAEKTRTIFLEADTCCGVRRTPKARDQQEQQLHDEEAGIELPEMPAPSVAPEDPRRLSGPPDLPHPGYRPRTPASTIDSGGGADLATADRFSWLPSREPSPFGSGQYDALELRSRDGSR